VYQQPGRPSLQQHYLAQLKAGTSALLNATRARLAAAVDGRLARGVPPEHTDGSLPTWDCDRDDGDGPRAQAGTDGGGVCPGTGEAAATAEATGFGALAASLSQAHHARHAAARAHAAAEVLLALKHPWSTARLSPMAANVQWLLYDCGDGRAPSQSADQRASATTLPPSDPAALPSPAAMPHGTADSGSDVSGLWVKMLHNEREVQFPACADEHGDAWEWESHHLGGAPEAAAVVRSSGGSDATLPRPADGRAAGSARSSGGTLESVEAPDGAAKVTGTGHALRFACPWPLVKRSYREAYARLNLTSCDAADYASLCAVPAHNAGS
jgi:hypothetical protein